ncbi:S10 family peptidase [Amycolatopsis sp. NPDC098790]|uniref:S10 family peptidase n=1 Tax=Amycolatopsis sp. NPDC098790 TaxID=3363939 RepID=UPI003830633A
MTNDDLQRYEAKQGGTFNDVDLEYTFALDLMPVRDRDGHALGTSSVFSYVANVPSERWPARPVVFIFNGGPGASSAFLHLSGIGPKRMAIPTDLSQGIRPPYVVEDSTHSLLDTADLVFVDPVDTGFGRAFADVDTDELFSVEGDARYFADIITEWIARHDRWNSPKHVLGESYGTQRAPFLAAALMQLRPVPLDGIILLGQAINVQETRERPGNVVGAVAALPFQAATAWHHGLGSRQHRSVADAVDVALDFAYGDYAVALLKGNTLPDAQREIVAKQLETITGIRASYYLKKGLYVSKPEFLRELLAERGQVLGTNDSRYVAAATTKSAGEAEFDPSGTYLRPAFTAGASRYIHGTLDVPFTTDYRLLDMNAVARWDWSDAGSNNFMQMGKPSPFHTYPYVARLTQFLKQAPEARVFIGTGYYDGLTTVGAVEHLLRQYDIPRDRVVSHRYAGGHMMYTDPESAVQLTTDLRAFLRR